MRMPRACHPPTISRVVPRRAARAPAAPCSQALSLDLFSLAENVTLVGMKTLAEGDRWFSPPSCCVQPHQMDTADPWFECLLLRARRTRGRRARVPSASPCCAGGEYIQAESLWWLLRGWAGGCDTKYRFLVLPYHPRTRPIVTLQTRVPLPRTSDRKPPKTPRAPPAQQGDDAGTLARLPLVLRARNKRHSNQGSAVSI